METRSQLKSELEKKEKMKPSRMKRLPKEKHKGLKYRTKNNNMKNAKLESHKIEIIDPKKLRKLPTDPNEGFVGTLHLV